jgi:hypothetical protein
MFRSIGTTAAALLVFLLAGCTAGMWLVNGGMRDDPDLEDEEEVAPTDFAQRILPRAFPGGVMAPDRRLAFVVGASQNLEAVDLASGKMVWRSTEARLPLLVVGGRLWAQDSDEAGKPRLVQLDLARQGKKVWQSESLTLPAGVGGPEGEGKASSCHAWLDNGQVVYHYRWDWSYTGGAQPPPGMPLHETKTGVVRVSPVTGRATPQAGGDKALDPLPVEVSGLCAMGVSRQAQTHAWILAPGGRIPGPISLAVASTENGSDQRLLWKGPAAAGCPAPLVDLLQGKSLDVVVPGGGRLVFVRRPEDENSPRPWKVFRLSDGRSAGSAPARMGTDQLAASQGMLLYRVEQAEDARGPVISGAKRFAEAMSWPTGAVLWRYPLAPRPSQPLRCAAQGG